MANSATAPPRGETQILGRVVETVASLLPSGWSLELLAGERGADGDLLVVAPDSASARLPVEVRTVVEGRDVAALRERLAVTGSPGLVAARYIPPAIRERLAAVGLSYADVTGNVRVGLERPGLFVLNQGADRDPWRGPGRPRGTLKGDPAARVVRALLDMAGDWSVRRLIEASGASTGSVYRVMEFLQTDGLTERRPTKEYVVTDWAALLRRWSQDYGFVRSGQTSTWIAARGLNSLTETASRSPKDLTYAFTGTIAAQEWASYAPARNAMVYVTDPEAAADAWGLKPADAGANVVLSVPQTSVVFDRTIDRDGLKIAAPAQVAVDLITGPGRAPSEAEELIEWMRRNESTWRH